MGIDDFVEKEKYNSAYADGFKAGLSHAENTIYKVEQKLHSELRSAGLKNCNHPATTILRHIIKEIWE